jgi:hypothetical protein
MLLRDSNLIAVSENPELVAIQDYQFTGGIQGLMI